MNRVAVGAYFTPEYAHWFPEWLESVRALTRQPDEVVVVTRSKVPGDVRKVPPPRGPFTWAGWRNALAAACADHDYLVSVDVDDRYLPHALDGCDEWTADIVAYGLRYTGGDGAVREWLPDPTTAQVASAALNLVPEGSPTRLDLWARNPWDERFKPFADFAFWVTAARMGATFSTTGRVDYEYRWHPDTPTSPDGFASDLRRALGDRQEGLA